MAINTYQDLYNEARRLTEQSPEVCNAGDDWDVYDDTFYMYLSLLELDYPQIVLAEMERQATEVKRLKNSS